jgi:hypothetical protein
MTSTQYNPDLDYLPLVVNTMNSGDGTDPDSEYYGLSMSWGDDIYDNGVVTLNFSLVPRCRCVAISSSVCARLGYEWRAR